MKKMILVLTVLATVVGVAFSQGISKNAAFIYKKHFTCGHTEDAYTTDKTKAGHTIEVSGECDACKYNEKRKKICTDPQSTTENRDTYKCNTLNDIFGY